MTAEQVAQIRSSPVVLVVSRLSTALPAAGYISHLANGRTS